MEETKTFTEWLRPEKPQWVKDSERGCEIYKKYHGFLELATSEEKVLLRKLGYQPDPIIDRLKLASP